MPFRCKNGKIENNRKIQQRNILNIEEIFVGESKNVEFKAQRPKDSAKYLIEAWGSGIPKLMESMQEYGLREPEFRDMEIGFRINLYRNMEETRMGTDQGVQKVDQDIQKLTDDAVKISVYTEYNLTDKSKAVLALIKEQPDITQREIAAQLGWKINRVKYQIDKMKSQNVIQRIGTSQKGYWKILIKNSSF